MTFEVEFKAWLQEPDAIERKVAKLGSLRKDTLKEDIYFRPRGDNSRVPANRFRLRRESGSATVNFKRKVLSGSVEVNQETEFNVDDTFAFFSFVDAFGFEPFVVKRKQSRVYQVGRAGLELNQVEHLGHFIEIEILCEKESEVEFARVELGRLYNRLALPPEAIETRYYIDMIQEAYPAQYHFIDDPTLEWPFEAILP
jgi:predicted adenylyl cyclase CyaB